MAEQLITLAQLRVIVALAEAWRATGLPPTVRELGDRLGASSTNGVTELLRALRARGLVTWQPYTARTLVITEAGRQWVDVTEEDLARRIIKARAERRRTGRSPGAPAGNRNASREARAAKAARVAAEIEAARGAA